MPGETTHSPTGPALNSSPEPLTRQFTISSESTLEHSPAQSDTEPPVAKVANEILNVKRAGHTRKRRDRHHRSRVPAVWKKILWVKQSYPDNYTDPPTFLSHLQWNPRVEPYDFWPLVSDSTVIVQHVCSVVIFICCFIGIYQERVSPISIVGWGSTCTFICWLFWDAWIGYEEREKQNARQARQRTESLQTYDSRAGSSPLGALADESSINGLGLSVPKLSDSRFTSRSPSPNPSMISNTASISGPQASRPAIPSISSYNSYPLYNAPASFFSARWQQRLATAKSAVLIYCALLGLSPILKSLTMSTTSDSIWAMSSWLLLINVFFYDYSGEGTENPSSDIAGAKYQSSLSTNAALMASTVLASRLTSTTHVFSLTLFSIEVFGLFPVFRRHLRQQSSQLHVVLTGLLIVVAGAGLGIVLAEQRKEAQMYSFGLNWKAGFIGALLWSLGNILAMGACSWWLISLQKYKNVVIGPWDPAKPIVRGGGMELGGYG